MQERYGILQDLDHIVIMLQSWIFFNSCKSFSFLISTIEILAWLWFAKIPFEFSSYFNCISQASQIACTVTTIYVTYTQTASHIHKNSCIVSIHLWKSNLNQPICLVFFYLVLSWHLVSFTVLSCSLPRCAALIFFLFERRNANNVKCLSLTFKYFTAFKQKMEFGSV